MMYSLCAIIISNLSCKSAEAGSLSVIEANIVQQQSVDFLELLSVARPPHEML